MRVGLTPISADTKAFTLSTESISSPSQPLAGGATCVACGSPLAADQRYCLECGERTAPMRSALLGGGPAPGSATPAPSTPPLPPRGPQDAAATGGRNTALTVIAGVGVLMLAMGVGVLIGRAGVGKQTPAPAQVITVAAGGGGTGTGAEASFTGDWPAGTKGYTVQLQTLPTSSTTVSVVEAAKSTDTGKGATGVGALKSDEYSSLTAGSYVIYAGVYHKRAEAQKALAGLKHSFPSATVIAVTSGSGASSTSKGSNSPSSSGSGSGSGSGHPAPPTVLESLKGAKGKSYEEKSKALPNEVET